MWTLQHLLMPPDSLSHLCACGLLPGSSAVSPTLPPESYPIRHFFPALDTSRRGHAWLRACPGRSSPKILLRFSNHFLLNPSRVGISSLRLIRRGEGVHDCEGVRVLFSRDPRPLLQHFLLNPSRASGFFPLPPDTSRRGRCMAVRVCRCCSPRILLSFSNTSSRMLAASAFLPCA